MLRCIRGSCHTWRSRNVSYVVFTLTSRDFGCQGGRCDFQWPCQMQPTWIYPCWIPEYDLGIPWLLMFCGMGGHLFETCLGNLQILKICWHMRMMIGMKWAAGFWLIWIQILQVALRSSSAPWLRNCWFARISASLALAQSTSSVWTHLCRRPGCGRSSHIFTNMSGGEVVNFFVRGLKHG